MALALEVDEQAVAEAARELEQRAPEISGLQVKAVAGGWQTVTRPEYAVAVARFVGKRAQKLSKAALETLAILAYNQPSTQPEIEAIRGVDSSGVLKSLAERSLVKEAGRKEAAGRPILYETTDDFLVYFGLNSIQDMPDQSVLEAMLDAKQSEENETLLVTDDAEESLHIAEPHESEDATGHPELDEGPTQRVV